LVFVNNSTDAIQTISSTLNAGELLYVRANGNAVIFSNIDNIAFLTTNPSSRFSINNGEIATFVKIDNIVGSNFGTYQLVSVLKTLT
jgi:hypothetical protein